MAEPLDPWLRGILRCPVCLSPLDDATGPGGGPELWCDGSRDAACRRQYRVDDGIPVLLADEARHPGQAPADSAPGTPPMIDDGIPVLLADEARHPGQAPADAAPGAPR